jgi:hypothetical protein
MIRYDFYGVETVFCCSMQIFGTTNTTLYMSLLGVPFLKKIQRTFPCHNTALTTIYHNHCIQNTTGMTHLKLTALRAGNYPGHYTGGGGRLSVKNIEKNDNKKVITQQPHILTLNLCTFISFNYCLPVTVGRLNSLVKVAG